MPRPRRPTVTAKRTSIAIGPEEKLVLDWWIGEKRASSMSAGIRDLLEFAERKEWSDLVTSAQNSLLRCEVHNEPLLLARPGTDTPLCRRCAETLSISERSELMHFCRTHNCGYHRYCSMCETEKMKRDIPVRSVTGAEAINLESKGAILIDVRRTRHCPGTISGAQRLMYDEFLDARKGELLKSMRKWGPETKLIIFDDDGEGRSFAAACELILRYGMENRVSVIKGGIQALCKKVPERFVEDGE